MTLSKLGRLAMHSIVFATMNCNLALLPYTDCVSDMMQSNAIDVFALQESNVSVASWSSFQKCMKKKGYNPFHQKTERGGTLVTLLTRCPLNRETRRGLHGRNLRECFQDDCIDQAWSRCCSLIFMVIKIGM